MASGSKGHISYRISPVCCEVCLAILFVFWDGVLYSSSSSFLSHPSAGIAALLRHICCALGFPHKPVLHQTTTTQVSLSSCEPNLQWPSHLSTPTWSWGLSLGPLELALYLWAVWVFLTNMAFLFLPACNPFLWVFLAFSFCFHFKYHLCPK